MSNDEISARNVICHCIHVMCMAVRHYEDVKSVEFIPDQEIVKIHVEHPTCKYDLNVNVACDSEAAFVHDIEAALYKHFT